MPPRRISLSEVDRRNVVYSDAEQIVIKNGLKTIETSLLRLDTLRSNGAARRCQLNDQIRRCQTALAPFKKIPNEIWMYIFELYCQSSLLSTCDTLAEQSPVVITQVCSAWRQIALSMPKLWSDVHLSENVDLARMWLERAGNIPRALEITTPRSYYSSSNRPQTIENVICSFPFRKLHLAECDAAGIDFTAIPVESLLPLEDLALLKTVRNSTVTSFPLHHFPNLVSLRIDTDTMPLFHVSRPFATWKNLRVLRLECKLKTAEYFEILCDASSVEDCSLCLDPPSYYYSQASRIENAIVANLKILRLSFSSTYSLWSLLNHLTFPNLHSLTIVSKTSVNFDKSSLLRLVPHIGSLRSLNIHQFYVNVDVGLVLECLPLLQVLELHCQKITTNTVENIGIGELGGCLRELHDWSPQNLYGFLRTCELRRDVTQGQPTNTSGAVARLEKVSARHTKAILSSCKRRIGKLNKNGVEFKVF